MSAKHTTTMLQFHLAPVTPATGGNPGVERIIPHDISIYGIQVVNNQNDTTTLEPRMKLIINSETFIGHPDLMPTAPFVKPYFLSIPKTVLAGSRIRLEVFLPVTIAAAPATPLPEVYIFYRDREENKSGHTQLLWTRVSNTTLSVPLTLSSIYPCYLRGMFTWEDCITAPAPLGLISYPSIVSAPLTTIADTRNLWALKREDHTHAGTSGFFDNIVDQGYIDLWKWGHFVRSVAAAPASLPKIDRYRFFDPLYLGVNRQLVLQRPWTWTPPAGVPTDFFTNFVFEFDELRDKQYAR